MRINPITNSRMSYSARSARVNPTDTVNPTSTSFKSRYNYLGQFEASTKADLKKSFNTVQGMFYFLSEAAKDVPNLAAKIDADLIISDSIWITLNNMRNEYSGRSNEILLLSNEPLCPVVTVGDGKIQFHHPKKDGETIDFEFDRQGKICVTRPQDYHRFDTNGTLREFYRRRPDGSITDRTLYNKDGVSTFWSNLFG